MSERRNFSPTVWGPHAWEFLDRAVLSYPSNPTPDDVVNMRAFLTAVGYALPCESCREHYAQYLAAAPLSNAVLSGWRPLAEWLLACHNRVRSFSDKEPISMPAYLDYYLGSGISTVALERPRLRATWKANGSGAMLALLVLAMLALGIGLMTSTVRRSR